MLKEKIIEAIDILTLRKRLQLTEDEVERLRHENTLLVAQLRASQNETSLARRSVGGLKAKIASMQETASEQLGEVRHLESDIVRELDGIAKSFNHARQLYSRYGSMLDRLANH